MAPHRFPCNPRCGETWVAPPSPRPRPGSDPGARGAPHPTLFCHRRRPFQAVHPGLGVCTQYTCRCFSYPSGVVHLGLCGAGSGRGGGARPHPLWVWILFSRSYWVSGPRVGGNSGRTQGALSVMSLSGVTSASDGPMCSGDSSYSVWSVENGTKLSTDMDQYGCGGGGQAEVMSPNPWWPFGWPSVRQLLQSGFFEALELTPQVHPGLWLKGFSREWKLEKSPSVYTCVRDALLTLGLSALL